MADNIVLNSGSGGATLAADDISSVWYPIDKLAFGPLDTATLVTATVGLPVDIVDADQNAVLGTATYTEATTIGTVVGAVRNDTLAPLAGTDNEIAPFQVNAAGALYVEVSTQATGAVTNTGTFAVQIVDTSFAVADGNALGEGVLIQGDDGTDRKNLNVDATTGDLQVDVTNTVTVDLGANNDVSLNAGTNNIGDVDILSIAAGDNNIGNVDIITVLTGSGALNLGKIEDGPHSSGDLGVMALAIRDDALTANALVGADLDYVPLRTNNDGALWMQPSAGNLGGCKMFTSVDLDESEEDPTAGATTIYGMYVWNLTAAPLWLQMFNTNTVTVGTTAPTNNFMIPANADSDGAGVVHAIPVNGLAYSTALTVAITTGSGTNNGAPGAGDAGIVIYYQD